MTRINVIDPKYLTDQHVMAEYRELPMVMGSLRRSLASKHGIPPIPPRYTLNKGHVTWFYPHGKFLHRRYNALISELTARGYILDPARSADFSVFTNNGLYGDWQPDESAMYINAERVSSRISQKPHWYKYYGKPLLSLPLLLQSQITVPTAIWCDTSM